MLTNWYRNRKVKKLIIEKLGEYSKNELITKNDIQKAREFADKGCDFECIYKGEESHFETKYVSEPDVYVVEVRAENYGSGNDTWNWAVLSNGETIDLGLGGGGYYDGQVISYKKVEKKIKVVDIPERIEIIQCVSEDDT